MYDYSMDKDKIFRCLNSHNQKIKELQEQNQKLLRYIEALENSLSSWDMEEGATGLREDWCEAKLGGYNSCYRAAIKYLKE